MKALAGVSGSGILGAALLRRLGKEAAGFSLSGRNGTRALDIADAAQLEKFCSETDPAIVLNAAAYSDVDGCERDPEQAWRSNALGVQNLAQACSRRGIPFLHVSTNYVFSGQKGAPYLEDDLPGPVNIYGMTKFAGESFALQCASPLAVVRTSWLFGPGNPQNFVEAVAKRLKSEPLVRILDDQTDAPTYTEDLVDGLLKIKDELLKANADKRPYREIYQICNAGTTTRLEMTRVMQKALKSSAQVNRLDFAEIKGRLAVRPVYGAMSPAKFEKRFGVKMRPWQDALTEYLSKA